MSNKYDHKDIRQEACSLQKSASISERYIADMLIQLLDELDKDLQAYAMANMSHHIANLKNEMTGEQIDRATNGAARELLNGRDEYNRAEAWKDVYDKMMDCEAAHPSRRSTTALSLAKALNKARRLEK
jgi:hypothetical protein